MGEREAVHIDSTALRTHLACVTTGSLSQVAHMYHATNSQDSAIGGEPPRLQTGQVSNKATATPHPHLPHALSMLVMTSEDCQTAF